MASEPIRTSAADIERAIKALESIANSLHVLAHGHSVHHKQLSEGIPKLLARVVAAIAPKKPDKAEKAAP